MKQIFSFGLTAALLLACLTGCGGHAGDTAPGGTAPSGGQTPPASSVPETPAGQGQTPPVSPDPERGVAAGEISREEALAIALDNADVPEGDAYNIKNETDSDNGIPIYDIEFETDYGDYDFEVAMADGRIVGADYEVDEEGLHVSQKEESALLPWEQIYKMVATKHNVLVYSSRINAYVIPRAQLGESYAALQTQAAAHLPAYRLKMK